MEWEHSNAFQIQERKLSRSKLELFTQCPRCFYLDRRLGVGRVGFPAFTLNSATDTLLKKEFDIHRADQTPHRLMAANNIDAVPFQHEMIDEWRENFKGVQYLHEPTNLLITGAVDDLWMLKIILVFQRVSHLPLSASISDSTYRYWQC